MPYADPAHDPDLQPLAHFRGTRLDPVPADRKRAIERAAQALREELLAAEPVAYLRSFDLVHLPYPTRYALRDACRVPWPFVQMVNRLIVVQFRGDQGRVRTLLVSPTDVEGSKATPFFRRLSQRMGPLAGVLEPLVAPQSTTVEAALAVCGIHPHEVDYLTYDHLHTQDVRRWLGSPTVPGVFPNAKLLVMRQEWQSVLGLLPPQRHWYCPDGIAGVDRQRVVLLDGDTRLGQGVALVATPGHTAGNHSIVLRTPEGLLVTSENGVSADCYAPLQSRIPGLAAYARATGMEVVLNGNTLEGALDQYLSMILEKTLAGPALRDPDFPAVMPSSELDATWLAPGLRPTLFHGELCFGAPLAAHLPASAQPWVSRVA